MINKSLLKIICIFSIIVGGILGVIPLIPAFTWIAFLAVMFLVAPFMIIYLKKLNYELIDKTKLIILIILAFLSIKYIKHSGLFIVVYSIFLFI